MAADGGERLIVDVAETYGTSVKMGAEARQRCCQGLSR